MSLVETAAQKLGQTSDSIVEFASELPKDLAFWKPAEDVWSIMEILCHVEEVINYWPGEIKRIVESPGVEWGRGLQDKARLEAVAQAEQRTVADVLEGIKQSTQNTQEILRTLNEEDLKIESPSRNPNFGTKPVSFIINHLLTEHVANHLQQMKRNVEQYENLSK